MVVEAGSIVVTIVVVESVSILTENLCLQSPAALRHGSRKEEFKK
jgi:hypothetical protein